MNVKTWDELQNKIVTLLETLSDSPPWKPEEVAQQIVLMCKELDKELEYRRSLPYDAMGPL